MNSIYPWIYVDYKYNVWKFFRNDNRDLYYVIMYGEGKWTKETLIEKDVLGFSIFIEEDETIHIVYSNIKRELKYCTMKNKQWLGKTLYQMELNEFEMQNLKVKIIGTDMHIFCLLVGNDGSDHGVLMHFIWNGKEIKTTTLYDIILAHNIKDHYRINVDTGNNIEIFFATDEGDEISINYSNYEGNKWSSIKRLYGIQGEDIDFEVLRDNQNIHILNRSREDSIYLLDHVHIDIDGNVQEFKVYENNKELKDPLVFIEDNRLCSSWISQGKIFSSIFEYEKWSEAFYFNRGNDLSVSCYNCFDFSDRNKRSKAMEVYATNELDFYLYFPRQFLSSDKDTIKYRTTQTNIDASKEETGIQTLKLELSKIKLEKKNMENRIDSLNIQLQNKQRSLKRYEDELAKLLEQKRKSDENYKVFQELQQNTQKELENTSRQLLEERKINENIESQIQEYKEENMLIEEENARIKEEVKLIKEEIKLIRDENKKLSKELEVERNQSIMDRLLKKKPSGI